METIEMSQTDVVVNAELPFYSKSVTVDAHYLHSTKRKYRLQRSPNGWFCFCPIIRPTLPCYFKHLLLFLSQTQTFLVLMFYKSNHELSPLTKFFKRDDCSFLYNNLVKIRTQLALLLWEKISWRVPIQLIFIPLQVFYVKDDCGLADIEVSGQ